MSGYLEEYGAGEEKRETLLRNSIVIAAVVIVVTAFCWYFFTTFPEVRATKRFLNRVRAKDYGGAYAAWGCTSAQPCKDYPYTKFLEDWGPQSGANGGSSLRITDSESCGTGVIVTVDAGAGQQSALFVEKGSPGLSFSPVAICAHRGPWSIMLHRTLGRLRWVYF
jgi:hypothetical protein